MIANRVMTTQHMEDSQTETKRLIDKLRSQERQEALGAVFALRQRGLLTDGSMKMAYLARASLEDAPLEGADLAGVVLWEADLVGTNLAGANLAGAFLLDADLSVAVLKGANLEGAILCGADLEYADLRWTELSGARLDRALLPDQSLWSPRTDMGRFTDPSHPDFWDPTL